MQSNNSIHAIGYCRVSTLMQKEDGVSLETQAKTIQQYCDFKGLILDKIYTDAAVSGKTMNRPEFKKAISEVKPSQYFIVYDLARFSRNTLEAMGMVRDFEAENVHFVSIKNDMDLSTPMGRCMFRNLMSFYELERDNIAANVKANMQRLSAEGKLRTKAPFGWKFIGKDKDMVKDPEQQAVIFRITGMYQLGWSLNKIAQTLNTLGDGKVLNNNKKKLSENPTFYSHTIKRILIDQGIIVDQSGRKPLKQRIISHHKSANDAVLEFNSPETFGPIDPEYPYPYDENWEGKHYAMYKVTFKDKKIVKIEKNMTGSHPYIAHWEVDPITGIQTNVVHKYDVVDGRAITREDKYTYGNGPDKYFSFVKERINEFIANV